ncbi:hypothetical protein [Bartonella quintana]|uniref:hypothetical protein n=1 Tax=Bartonella quintana TaxID=803 RepID=UPI001F0ABA8E|nr:hypothetical protein [Bartonella quintana]
MQFFPLTPPTHHIAATMMLFTGVSSTTARVNMSTIFEIKQKLSSQTEAKAKPTTSQCEAILFGWQALASTNQVPVSTDRALFPTNQMPVSTDHALFSTNQMPVSTNHAPSSTDQAFASTDQVPVSTDRALFSTNQTPVSTNRASSSTDQAFASTDQKV